MRNTLTRVKRLENAGKPKECPGCARIPTLLCNTTIEKAEAIRCEVCGKKPKHSIHIINGIDPNWM